MVYDEIKDALNWLIYISKKHNYKLPLIIDFLKSFKNVLDIAYDLINNDDLKNALIELKIKNIDAVMFFMIDYKIFI